MVSSTPRSVSYMLKYLTFRPSPRFAPVTTTTFPLCERAGEVGSIAAYLSIWVVLVNAVELTKKSGGKDPIFEELQTSGKSFVSRRVLRLQVLSILSRRSKI